MIVFAFAHMHTRARTYKQASSVDWGSKYTRSFYVSSLIQVSRVEFSELKIVNVSGRSASEFLRYKILAATSPKRYRIRGS